MSKLTQRADSAPLWAVVSGDGLASHWIEVDTGLTITTERASVEIDDDVEASAAKVVDADLYPAWATGQAVEAGDYRIHDGELYSCIQGHTTQIDWPPDVVPALWHHWPKAAAGEDYPPWVQPTGAHDAYHIGDRVTYNGQNWECVAGDANGNNVWAPGVYGWVVIV